jgi:hypothetical protein
MIIDKDYFYKILLKHYILLYFLNLPFFHALYRLPNRTIDLIRLIRALLYNLFFSSIFHTQKISQVKRCTKQGPGLVFQVTLKL